MDKKYRQREIEKASIVGIGGNLFLALISITAGFLFNSLALIGAGIDAATDIVSSVITLFTARIAARPPDRDHPYGHSRAETVATKILAFLIFFAGAQLAMTTFQNFRSGGGSTLPSLIPLVTAAVSVAGKLLLYRYKLAVGRRVSSPMLVADARNMLADVVLTVSVFLGIILTRLIGLSVIDLVVAGLVSIWIMRTAFSIFMESSQEVMDGVEDMEIYNHIFEAVHSVSGASEPHRVRVRKLNTFFVIDMDVEVDGNLTVYEGHEIVKRVEEAIKKNVKDVYDIIVHMEPSGNYESAEQFGLSEHNIDGE